jgi:hypothetical protein
MNSQFGSAAVTTARFIDAAMKLRGGRVSVSVLLGARSLWLKSHPLPIGRRAEIERSAE